VAFAQLPIQETYEKTAVFDSDPVAVLEAMDCLRVAVTLFDRNERLVYLNQHLAYIFRSLPPAATLIGHSYEDLIRMELDGGEIASDSFAGGADEFVARLRAQLTSGDFAPRDIHMADGRIIEIKARHTQDNGWIVLWSDVTSARHAFARLETAVELSADAFAYWDKTDRLVMCNPEFARLHGWRNSEKLMGMAFNDMIAATAERGLVSFSESKESWIEKRIEAHHASAGALTVVMANGTAYLVRERATRDGGRATIYTDVTDRHRAETAFAEQTKTLNNTKRALDAQANYLADLARRLDKIERGTASAKTTFLRTMGHELKTPLNAIIGFSDLLKTAPEHFSGEQVSEYAKMIHAAGGNLLTMLTQILELTKIASGRYPINPANVSVHALFDDACNAVHDRARDKSISIETDGTIPGLAITGDETALTTMVNQLVGNAVFFTQKGGRVELSAQRKGTRIVLRIEDNGPGVATDDLARIVEPFEQLGRDPANISSGGGLGLPLVKALAELQGGTLSLESAPGEGFTAILDMPAA